MSDDKLTTWVNHQNLLAFFLCSTLLVLPIWEFPKLLFLLLFLLTALYSIYKQRKTLHLNSLDLVLIVWLFSGFVIAWFAPLDYKQWKGALSHIFIPIVLFFLRHLNLSQKASLILLMTSLIATLIATIQAYWYLYSGQEQTLMLNSVGHVNHSAIYLTESFVIALAFGLCSPFETCFYKGLNAFILGFLVVAIIYTDSRGALICTMLIAVALTSCNVSHSKKPLFMALFLVVITFSALFIWKPPIVSKTLKQTDAGQFLPERIKIWNSAMLIWRNNPAFGVGMRNYSRVNQVLQTQWLKKENARFSFDRYLPYSHAHNLFLNTLAEQGLFGLSLLVMILAYLIFSYAKYRPKPQDDQFHWLIWIAGAGNLLVVCLIGLVNTTLHHEHGLLFAVVTGLWLSHIRKNQQKQTRL